MAGDWTAARFCKRERSSCGKFPQLVGCGRQSVSPSRQENWAIFRNEVGTLRIQ